MRKSVIFAAFLLAAAFVSFARSQAAPAAPSSALDNVVTEVQKLSQDDFNKLVVWARSGADKPPFSFDPVMSAERDISELSLEDRTAVSSWLLGLGALYDRGVKDSQIGTGPAPAPTPSPWRDLPIGTSPNDGKAPGDIQVFGEFAGAELNGRAAAACVSFRNIAAKTANEVLFEFSLLNGDGAELGTLTLDRKGTFSPNVGIYTFSSLNVLDLEPEQDSIPSSRGYGDNCVLRSFGIGAPPVLQARFAKYRVMKVIYDDGTVWNAATR